MNNKIFFNLFICKSLYEKVLILNDWKEEVYKLS